MNETKETQYTCILANSTPTTTTSTMAPTTTTSTIASATTSLEIPPALRRAVTEPRSSNSEDPRQTDQIVYFPSTTFEEYPFFSGLYWKMFASNIVKCFNGFVFLRRSPPQNISAEIGWDRRADPRPISVDPGQSQVDPGRSQADPGRSGLNLAKLAFTIWKIKFLQIILDHVFQWDNVSLSFHV